MIGHSYRSTGITLRYGIGVANGLDGWAAEVKFHDDGFGSPDFALNAGQVSTEGELRTRYFVSAGDGREGAVAAAQAVRPDAARMGSSSWWIRSLVARCSICTETIGRALTQNVALTKWRPP